MNRRPVDTREGPGRNTSDLAEGRTPSPERHRGVPGGPGESGGEAVEQAESRDGGEGA